MSFNLILEFLLKLPFAVILLREICTVYFFLLAGLVSLMIQAIFQFLLKVLHIFEMFFDHDEKWSGPDILLSNVKCFSTILAPSARLELLLYCLSSDQKNLQ